MLGTRTRRHTGGLASGVLFLALVTSRALADPPPAPPGTPPPAGADAAAPAAGAKAPAEEQKPLLDFPLEVGLDRDGHGVIGRADGTIVYFYTTNFVSPTDLITSAELMKLPWKSAEEPRIGVKFTAFPAQNQVLLEGFQEDVSMALTAIEYFDVPAPQVFVEAKVVEITWDSNFEFGLDYLLDRGTTGPNTIWQGVGGNLAPPSLLASALPGGLPFQGTSLLLGFMGQNAIDFGAFEAAFHALHENGKAEILSNPSIICTQGKKATVITSESFNVNQLKSANRNNETYEPAPANTGVDLQVTATHVGSGYVTIDLFPTVRGVAGFASRIGGTLSPITTVRSANTTVTLADRETLVLGGLYTNRTVKEEAKTPLLSDMPIVGTLFTRQRESKQKTELFFILTPKIIRKGSDRRVISPPAELKRLERSESLEDAPPCGPCKPNPRMQDLLFPREAACNDLQRRRTAQANAAPAPEPLKPDLPPPVVRPGASRGSDDPAPAR